MPPPPRPQPQPHPAPGFVAVGLIRGPRGVRGELKIQPLTDFPERFRRGATLWIDGNARTVRLSRMHLGRLLLQLEGVDTRPDAAALTNRLLEVPEEALAPLSEGSYYRFQIVGMDVVDTGGASLGRVEEILDTGANDVYIVRNDESELLLPGIDSVIKQVDVEARRMVVDVIDGLERRPLKRTPTRRVAKAPRGRGRAGGSGRGSPKRA